MSVASQVSSIQYDGNGSSSTPYPVPFRFIAAEHLRVIVTSSEGAETVLDLGSGFFADGVDDPTGSITTAAAWSDAYKVTISRVVPLEQLAIYNEGDNFPAKSHEKALDLQTMASQQIARQVDQALKVAETATPQPAVVPASNTALVFNGLGQLATLTAAQFAIWLNLTQQFFGAGIKVWLTAADRPSVVPEYLGQVGVQIDNFSLWIADGLAAGDWTTASQGIADGSIVTAMLADTILSADSDGRVKMADGFVNTAKLAAAALSADTDGRAKMADGFVTLAKLQSIASGSLIGRYTAGTGVPQVITVGDGLTFDGSTLKASGASPAGSVIQTVFATRTTLQSVTGSIPFDDTIPTSSEGTEVMTASITPSATSSKVLVKMTFFGSPSASYPFAVVALRGSTTLRAVAGPENNTYGSLSFEFLDSPASTSSQTYSMRAGISNGTLYVNGITGGTRIFGGAGMCSITLQEIKG